MLLHFLLPDTFAKYPDGVSGLCVPQRYTDRADESAKSAQFADFFRGNW